MLYILRQTQCQKSVCEAARQRAGRRRLQAEKINTATAIMPMTNTKTGSASSHIWHEYGLNLAIERPSSGCAALQHRTHRRSMWVAVVSTTNQGRGPMPTRAPRRCTRAGCPGGISCRQHQRKRSSSTALGYDREWRADSEQYRREHPWCEVTGCRRSSAHTDHIDGDNTNNQPSNWQAVCVPHHSRKTVEHDGGFGRPRTPRPGDLFPDRD